MSNLSIFEKKWLDLVFEGKNQEYGAYKLRQDSSKTTLLAFFTGILFLCFLSGIGLFFSSFGSKPNLNPETPIIDSMIVVNNYEEPIIEEVKPFEPLSNDAAPVEKSPSIAAYEVAPTDSSNTEVPTNEDLSNSNTSSGSETSTGTNQNSSNSGNTGPGTPEITPSTDGGIVAAPDVQPDFPGGIDNFRKQVGNRFNTPEIDEEKVISVLISFVIETDGSMTDIKVLRNPGYGLDVEAIRVLKSIKTKWIAAFLDGKPVRTRFSMPIKVKMN